MRGEHTMCLCRRPTTLGSSPHARGTRNEALRRRICFGIIPACAGNTELDRNSAMNGRDHPRMRGEHCSWIYHEIGYRGSSPHARGTLANDPQAGPTVRIIPACAGNTLRNPNNPNPNISLSIDFDSVYIICYQKLIQRL